jgi:hypothetical protein
MLSRQETLVINKITDEIETRKDLIASGSLTDYNEYRENCGFIKGLKTAIELIHEVNKEITGT